MVFQNNKNHCSNRKSLKKYSVVTSDLLARAGIHKRDQAHIEPKMSTSLQLFILNLIQFLAQFDLDPFRESGLSKLAPELP